MAVLMSRIVIGLRPPRCVTRRSDQEAKTVHYAGPSPWTTSRSAGGRGIDRSSPARFRDTANHAFCAAIWRSYQAYHMDARNGCDIFYSSGVCPHGVAFEGRGPGVQHGANGTTDGNRRSTSTQYIAGDNDPLTDEAKLAFHDEAARFGKPLRWEHKDWKSTQCAGPSVGPWRRQGFPKPVQLPPGPPPAPSPPPTTGVVNVNVPVLRRGNRGGAVRSLQALLNVKAGQTLVADGDFGPRTDAAVRNVQQFFRNPRDPFGPMPVDGIVGVRTWGVLFL